MKFAGKILVAKEKNIITAVKVNVDPTSRERWTNERASISDGTIVMCVYQYLGSTDPMDARRRGLSTTPYLFILHKERIWEANPHSYGAIDPCELLKGKSVCFTGNDDKLKGSRGYWKTVVEAYGGLNVSAVTSSTSFLVMGDKNSQSTKAVRARLKGTVCLGYDEFQNMLDSG